MGNNEVEETEVVVGTETLHPGQSIEFPVETAQDSIIVSYTEGRVYVGLKHWSQPDQERRAAGIRWITPDRVIRRAANGFFYDGLAPHGMLE